MQPLVDKPRARRTDPPTSHRAAQGIRRRLGKEQLRVKDLIKRYAARGLTSAELGHNWAKANKKTGEAWREYYHRVARRAPELAAGGFVRQGKQRQCRKTGNTAMTWFPMQKGSRTHKRVACRGCGAEIVFLKTRRGKWIPVDPLSVEDDDTEFDFDKHTAHHSTCPNQKEFKR